MVLPRLQPVNTWAMPSSPIVRVGGSTPAGTLEAMWRGLGGDSVGLVPGTSDYGVGTNRISFLVVDSKSQLIETPTASAEITSGRTIGVATSCGATSTAAASSARSISAAAAGSHSTCTVCAGRPFFITIGVAQAAIDALPETQRAVITLRDKDGWSSEEVRNVLGLSESNQRVLLHRARAKVRQALETYLEGDS